MYLQFQHLWSQIAKLENVKDEGWGEVYMLGDYIAQHDLPSGRRLITKMAPLWVEWEAVEHADMTYSLESISKEDFLQVVLPK